jgi:hypothetical protein
MWMHLMDMTSINDDPLLDTGYGFTFASGIIVYCSKTQNITATSSTEAEFIADVATAQVTKYLHLILHQFGFTQKVQKQPPLLYEDNKSAIKMVDAGRPTERSCHINIQYFAIKDWKCAGPVILKHSIKDTINPLT